jgi:acetyltransferase-like isoleucine patch superfamily enzyme
VILEKIFKNFFRKRVLEIVNEVINEKELQKNLIRHSFVSKSAKLYSTYSVSDSQIDNFTYVAKNAQISRTSIGKFCSIGPNFLSGWGIHPINGVSTSPMFYSTHKQNGTTLSEVDKIEERRLIVIGNDVFIGANVTVLDGITIGDGAIIGAGAVVSKDIPPYAIAIGCPIQIKKMRFDDSRIRELMRIKWWDFNEEELKNVEKYFFDIDGFISKYADKI